MTAEHWDAIYQHTPLSATGWYEDDPAVSLRLVERCSLAPEDPILDIGSGASTFVDRLLERGLRDIIATDISETALRLARERVPADLAGSVRLIVADVTKPSALGDLDRVALWHDRAALHFLVQDDARRSYADTLRRLVRPGGFVILAAFAIGGASRCSGLPVRNYDAGMFEALLGPAFRLLESVDHTYVNRRGEPRPYLYAHFRRDEEWSD